MAEHIFTLQGDILLYNDTPILRTYKIASYSTDKSITIINVSNSKDTLLRLAKITDFEVNGKSFTSLKGLSEEINSLLFINQGVDSGSGGSGVPDITLNSLISDNNEVEDKILVFKSGKDTFEVSSSGFYGQVDGGNGGDYTFTPTGLTLGDETDTSYYLNGTMNIDNGKYLIDVRNNKVTIDPEFKKNYLKAVTSADSNKRPELEFKDAGFFMYDKSESKMILWNGSEWTNFDSSPL